ncbi:MAG: hypothetical protein KDD62_16330, partial [Bdellovibrionales bacterium]|nr:hypothetical protein [Bdellovibrionales bacterium]
MSVDPSSRIHAELVSDGIRITWRGESYTVNYPLDVWAACPLPVKEVLLDNVTFACTMHLPMVVPGLTCLSYSTARPLFEPYFFQNFIRDLPDCAEADGKSIADEYKRFLNVDYLFNGEPIKPAPPSTFQPEDKALVAMSFGKDSLLSFAIADELALNPEMVYVHEESMTYEREHKTRLGLQFEQQFGKRLNILEHSTGLLRDYKHLKLPHSEYGWGLQSTEYALLMLPFAYYFKAQYLFIGNEQSAGMRYRDKEDAWNIYPCYDQTHIWTTHIDQMTSALSRGSFQTGSLIEPLMDMMIQRMLVKRYPRY